MPKQQLSKNQVKVRLAGAELAVGKLEADYQATTYRRNQVIADSIKSAREELNQAYEALFEDELSRAYRLCAVSWLHADFGRQLLDAENIEYILGESDYLELTDAAIPWESRARQYMGFLEGEVAKLREQIARQKPSS